MQWLGLVRTMNKLGVQSQGWAVHGGMRIAPLELQMLLYRLIELDLLELLTDLA